MSKHDVFIVFGEEKNTLAEVIETLGTKVKLKDIKAGKIEGVSIKEIEDFEEDTETANEELEAHKEDQEHTNEVTNELDEAAVTDTLEGSAEDTTESTNEPEDTVEDTIESTNEDTVEDKKDISSLTMAEKMAILAERHAKKVAENPEGNKKGKKDKVVFNGTFPEVGTIKDEKDLKKIYKQLTNEQLDEWITLEGLEYNKNSNEGINRMRKCMAITALHFPKTPSNKNKSKYADISTEQLIEMAIDAELDIKDHKGDNRILRMYLIMALRDANLLESK